MPATLGILQTNGTVLEVSGTNGLPVNIVGGGGSGGTAAADGATFTEGTTPVTPVGGEFNDAFTNATAGKVSVFRASLGRGLHVNLRNNAGAEIAPALDATLTTMSGKLPAALVGGRLDVNIGAGTVTTTPSGTQTVAGTVTANAGTGTFAIQATAAAPGSVELSDGAAFYTAAKTGQFPSALVGGRLDVNIGASANLTIGTLPAIPTGANTIGAVTQASGPWTVQGPAASNAAVSGNPVLTGGSDGTNAQVWLSTTTAPGFQRVATLSSGADSDNSSTTIGNMLDQAGTARNLTVVTKEFNGGGWDKRRNNVSVTHLSSASRSSTQGPTNVTTYNARALYVWVNCTSGSGTVTLKIDAIDSISGGATTLLTGTAVSSGLNLYKVGIGLALSANAVVVDYLPRTIALTLTSNAVALTYSVSYELIVA